MKYKQAIYACTFIFFLISCSNGKLEEKGFQVSPISDKTENEQSNDLVSDSLKIETRASGVLLTGHQNIRLTTI